MNDRIKRFILSVRTNGTRQSIVDIKDSVRRLIHDPGAEVVILDKLSLLLLSCRCRNADEVKRRIASCTSVEGVLDDFGTALPEVAEDARRTGS